MKLRLTYQQPTGTSVDLLVTADAETPVKTLAEALVERDPTSPGRPAAPVTLARYDETGRAVTVAAGALLGEAGIRSGSTVTVTATAAEVTGDSSVAAVLTVHSGPDAGATFDLPFGSTLVGRGADCPVRFSDPMVSTHHARIVVGEDIEIIDENSSNGLLVGGEMIPRLTLRSGDRVVLGETTITVAPRRAAAIGAAPVSPTVAFNRSPRVDPVYDGRKFVAPEPPSPPQPQRFPMISALMPFLMGLALFAATRNLFSVLFVALSPLMLIGGYFQNKRWSRQALQEATDHFRANLAALVVDLRTEADEQRSRRCIEHPGTADAAAAIDARSPLMWTRRPEHRSFMELRLGLGQQSSRSEVTTSNSRNSLPELHDELVEVVREFAVIDRVPIVGSLASAGSLGVSGPDEPMLAVARGLVIQLAALHSPAEVTVAAVASARTSSRWEWLKWLPHVDSDHSPLSCDHLAASAPGCANLVGELTALVEERSADSDLGGGSDSLPRVVLIVEDDAPVTRSRLVHLAEVGPSVGVHLIWTAGSTPGIPAACRSYIEVEPTTGTAATGRVVEGELSVPALVEPIDALNAERLARSLSPVTDAGALVNDESDVPSTVSFLADAGLELAEAPEAVVDRWRESNSLLGEQSGRARLKRDNSLRALVGRTASDPLHLDLRTQGPHALVGGTTGSGKSEFLQTWVLGMATAHSPQRVTFLFVDYKGGSAFADCVNLPHSVGLVTDLSPHLVQRALTSLNAELRYREHVLNGKKAKDLLELERRNDPEAPPSLVIVVDEFAALVQEVPEFVDGVVNVAQRGRSLGLHLILATQRPAGVIKDNLRANTNLRVALRMADEEDSRDVVGTPQAATFDPELPGRGVAKTGPGRLSLFQTSYVGGWTSEAAAVPEVSLRTLVFGTGSEWEALEIASDSSPNGDAGPADIQRIVDNVTAASTALGLADPRRPWLPELATTYDLAELPLPRRDSELVIGVADRPEHQEQRTVAFQPDRDGNIAVFGTSGAGKSALLRTLGVGAGLTVRGGPCFVYGLDFGSRGLSMLEPLPHVGSVIGADDVERTARLIAQLRDTLDERAVRYAKVNAGTIEEYRRLADAPQEPRVLLLLDGFAAFRNAFEVGPVPGLFDDLIGIAADGRPVGVHVAFSADRLGIVPSSLVSSVQQTVALRVSNEMDEAMLNIPKGGFGEAPPPGRGFLDGTELQVAVLGGSPDVAAQAVAIERLAESMRRAGAPAAPPIERLAEAIDLAALPDTADGLPTLGVSDATLGPIGFDPSGVVLVAGPAGSGRSTAVMTMVHSLRRQRPELEVVYLGNRRSPLAAMEWSRRALGPEEVMQVAMEVAADWQSSEGPSAPSAVVLDGVGQFLNSEADMALQDLLKVCRSAGVLVIADGETSDVAGSWPLLQAIKAGRHGLVLQPDQMDGDTLFRTSFPRMSRADFPPGRGMYVHRGRFQRVQVAQP